MVDNGYLNWAVTVPPIKHPVRNNGFIVLFLFAFLNIKYPCLSFIKI
jgi:hypothetical protein